MTTNFFLGACGPKSFSSQYASLLEELDTLNIIKGGSGCGKSTFMKRIGQAAESHGLDVSYIHCSSDPASLDGVILPALSLGYVDGTAPHVLEPKLCGGSMNYINFGALYDREAMRPHEPEIRTAQAANSAQYAQVTACLAAADRLMGGIRLRRDSPACLEELHALAECLALSTLQAVGQTPKPHRRYLNAITPDGLSFYTDTPAALCEKIYVLRDNYQLAPVILSQLRAKAAAMGHEYYACYSPLLPEGAPTHLLIPTAGVAFVSDSRDFPYSGKSYCTLELDDTLPSYVRDGLGFHLEVISALLPQAAAYMKEARRLHDRIEALCRPYVDFSAADRLTEAALESIFATL